MTKSNEIREMLLLGKRYREISAKLGASFSTISYHSKVLGKRKFTFTRKGKSNHCSRCDRQRERHSKFCGQECYMADRYEKREQIVKEGRASAGVMKAYLLHRFGNRCMSGNCQWDFDAQQIDCELEHIDGNSSNTTLENCKLLCPNCHSLTPTYKNRNKGNGRYYRRTRYAEGKSY